MSDDDSKDDSKDDEQKYYGWRDGMPTKPDVDLLMRTWPNPSIGDRFEYTAVEKLLGISRENNRARWNAVTNVWRKRMREKGFNIHCQDGRAFYVATTDQVTARTYGKMQSAGRLLDKQREELSVQKPESDEQRTLITHQGRLLYETSREMKKTRMNLLPGTAAREAPRITPLKRKK